MIKKYSNLFYYLCDNFIHYCTIYFLNIIQNLLIDRSLRKSFRCVPDKGKSNIPRFPEEPEKPLNLSHIV